MPYQFPPCQKCGRHHERLRIIKTDKATRKKWYVLTCPDCSFESDIEEYKRPNHNSSETNKLSSPPEGSDEGWWDDNVGESM